MGCKQLYGPLPINFFGLSGELMSKARECIMLTVSQITGRVESEDWND